MSAKVNMKRRKKIGRLIRSAMPKMTEERIFEGVKQFGLSYNDGEKVPEGGSDTIKKLLESGGSTGGNREIVRGGARGATRT